MPYKYLYNEHFETKSCTSYIIMLENINETTL